MVESRHPEGWGRVLELSVNKDHSGLGYYSQQTTVTKTMPNIVEGQVLPLPDIFTSVRHLMDGKISVVEEKEDDVVDEVGLVYQKLEGQELANWTSIEIPEVTMIKK